MNTVAKSALYIAMTALSGFGPLALASEEGFRISNGAEGWPVVFDDAGLSPSEKQAIFNDYHAICTRLAPRGSCETKTRQGESMRRMQYGAAFRRVPEAAAGHAGLLRREEDGHEVAVIDRALSDAYKKALAHREAHCEAYECLPDFVDSMNHLRERKLPGTLDEMLHYATDALQYRDNVSKTTVDEFAETFGQYRYELPSVLDYGEFEGLPMALLHVYPNAGEARFNYLPFVFVDGRWKMLVYAGMFV